jgi:hypothetical protein
MDTLNRDDFAAHLNTTFNVYFRDEEPTPVELIEVTPLRERNRAASFSMVFQGPPEPVWNQRLLRVEHPELGEGEIFLVPFAQVEKGVQYEAQFNRIVEKQNP